MINELTMNRPPGARTSIVMLYVCMSSSPLSHCPAAFCTSPWILPRYFPPLDRSPMKFSLLLLALPLVSGGSLSGAAGAGFGRAVNGVGGEVAGWAKDQLKDGSDGEVSQIMRRGVWI